MFCDLVGSAALADQLDAEDMRHVLGSYQRTCKTVIEQHGGTIARYVGDGLLVYFGFPKPFEDMAPRAVRSALGIVSAIGELKVLAHGLAPLQVRIGIESGSVLIGDVDSSASLERDAAIGSVPNVAARLQGLARPNAILVGAVAHGELGHEFESGPAIEVSLRGISRPMLAYQILSQHRHHESGAWHRERLEPPLIERDGQREQLRAAWQEVKRSRPAVICVSGEAGVGKSRLVRALIDDLREENAAQIYYRCAPQHQSSPLYPVAAQLQQVLFGTKEGEEDRRLALHLNAKAWGLPAAGVDALGLLAGMPPQLHGALSAMAPGELRRTMLGAVAAMVEATAKRLPTLLVVEDLHWCDPSTQEFLAALCSKALPGRLLVVMTCRPEAEPAWVASAGHTSMALSRLSRSASRQMLEALLAGRALAERSMECVLDRAEGIPLFLVELSKLIAQTDAHQQSAGDSLALLNIPHSLQASLATRLDRMAPARRMAQVAAALGRTFSISQLQWLLDCQSQDITENLFELTRSGVLAALSNRYETSPDEREFSHALIRDAAYHSMTREDRQSVHLRIAQSLESQFPSVSQSHPELVAHHFSEAGERAVAIHHWLRAGEKAMEQLANVETIEHLRRGLAMLDAVDLDERPHLELRFHTALMPALCATRGYANADVERTFSRAHELCKQLGSIPTLSVVLYALWVYFFVRADLHRARQLADEVRQIADRTGEPLQRMESELAAGTTALYVADLPGAAEHLQHILAIWSVQGPQCFPAGEDVRVSVKSWLGIVYWHMGDVDRANEVAQESLYRARQIGQPISLAFALYFNVFLAHFCQDIARVAALAEEGRQLCERHNIFWGTLCVLHQGWALTHGDEAERAKGFKAMDTGLGGFRLAGARLTQTYYLSMIAQSRLQADDLNECDVLVTEALAAAEETGETLWRSELLRLRGESTLAHERHAPRPSVNAVEAAETLFRQAIEQARENGASSLVLRASLPLARLLDQRQRHAEAMDVLSAALTPIRCVIGTSDIAQARSMLEQLRDR